MGRLTLPQSPPRQSPRTTRPRPAPVRRACLGRRAVLQQVRRTAVSEKSPRRAVSPGMPPFVVNEMKILPQKAGKCACTLCISADSAVQFESVRRCFRNAERRRPMQDWTPREHYTAEDLVEIIRILRDGGERLSVGQSPDPRFHPEKLSGRNVRGTGSHRRRRPCHDAGRAGRRPDAGGVPHRHRGGAGPFRHGKRSAARCARSWSSATRTSLLPLRRKMLV